MTSLLKEAIILFMIASIAPSLGHHFNRVLDHFIYVKIIYEEIIPHTQNLCHVLIYVMYLV